MMLFKLIRKMNKKVSIVIKCVTYTLMVILMAKATHLGMYFFLNVKVQKTRNFLPKRTTSKSNPTSDLSDIKVIMQY